MSIEIPEGVILSELSHDELLKLIEDSHKHGFAWGVITTEEKLTNQYGANYEAMLSKCTCQHEEYKGILTGDEG